jgi:hypothetical protein
MFPPKLSSHTLYPSLTVIVFASQAGAAAAAEGAAALTLHARNADQLYAPPVRWSAIAQLVDAVQVTPQHPPLIISRRNDASMMLPSSARADMTALPKVDTKCTAPSLIPTVNGNTVRSFSTHGQQSAAQGSSTTVSRSDTD